MNIKQLLQIKPKKQKIFISGWVRTKRLGKNISFISLNDGSTIKNIQIVFDSANISDNIVKQITTGACVKINGSLVASEGKGQETEVVADSIDVLGVADSEKYPLQPKKHSLEFLRENAHLRFRTNTFSAIFRIRNSISFAINKFFYERGFVLLHTPIITSTDAEGAGEMFQVTNLNLEKIGEKIDYNTDFFGQKTSLTVSGQLEAELGALGLGKVYTFGPTFRAENSNTSRHLSEFWMIEPEVAFADLEKNISLAEEFLKYCINYCIKHNFDDLTFLNTRFENEEKKLKKEDRSELGLIERLKFVVKNNFAKITYREAISILINSKPNKKRKFKYIIDGFGADLQSEHEKFLVEKKFKTPVIITDYPKKIKAFYMRLNDDNETVKAMDILFPNIGEIIGGSQREERLDVLKLMMKENNIDEKHLWWYLETRKFGSCVHSGFGLGLERLIMFVTGMKNIRDVIPFPRTPMNVDF